MFKGTLTLPTPGSSQNRTCLSVQLISYTLFATVLVMLWLLSSTYNEPAYTVETDYNMWVTKLPAITVCPAVSRRFVADRLKRLLKGQTVTPQKVTFYGNLVSLGKQHCAGCAPSQEAASASPLLSNITETVELISQPCESQLSDCSWNGIKFSCCQVFQPISTKRGICYALNSLQTRPTNRIPFNFVTSLLQPNVVLEVNSSSVISVNIHDRRAVSFPPPRPVFKIGEKAQILYKFRETVLLPTARELGPQQRRCVFNDELNIDGYRMYSYSTCKLACLARKQVQKCGCKHHHLRGLGRNCNFNGLICLDQHFGNMTKDKKKEKCGCRRDCTEQEIQIVHISSVPIANKRLTSVVVKLTKPPTERVVLQARTNFIEILVALGVFTRILGPATLEDFVRGGLFLISTYTDIAIGLFKWVVDHLKSKE